MIQATTLALQPKQSHACHGIATDDSCDNRHVPVRVAQYLSLRKPSELVDRVHSHRWMFWNHPGMVPCRRCVSDTMGIDMASGSAATLINPRPAHRSTDGRTRRPRPLAGGVGTSQALVFEVSWSGSMMIDMAVRRSLCAPMTLVHQWLRGRHL